MTDLSLVPAPPAAKKKKKLTEAQLIKELSNIPGGANAPGTTGLTPAPAEFGLTAAEQGTVVPFSVSSFTDKLPPVPGATTAKNGATQSTAIQAMKWLDSLNPDQLHEVESQLYLGKFLTTPVQSQGVTTSVRNAFKTLIFDAAGSKYPVLSYLNVAANYGSSNAATNYLKAVANKALTMQEGVIAPINAPYTQDTPNQITQALQSAMASIGAGLPSPELQDAFVTAFQSAQASAKVDAKTAVQQGEGAYLGQLYNDQAAAESGNPTELKKLETTPGPVIAEASPTPNLDTEAMAQAKAANPGQYYATGSSYMYAQLLKGLTERGVDENLQAQPTAPSQSTPGGAILGTPLVAGT